MSLAIQATSFSRYRVQFIGRGGRILAEPTESPARYDFTGAEGYVRAKVLESNGHIAWCQPVWVR